MEELAIDKYSERVILAHGDYETQSGETFRNPVTNS